MTRTLLVALLGLGFALTACNKESDDSTGAASSASSDDKPAEEKKPAKKSLDTLFAGKAPALPAPYKTLMPGMTAEEAKKVFPKMPDEDHIEVGEYPDIRFYADFDKKTKVLQRVYFDLPKAEAEKLVSAAWGEPIKGQTSIKKPISYWFNPETGLRATLEEGFGDEMKLEFTRYIPAAKFIGAEGEAFAFQAEKPLLGSSIEDLRANYADYMVEKSKKEAEADRKKLEAMMGKDKDKLKVLGKAKPSAHLEWPPTEYESYWTRVHLSFDDEGKVRAYNFGLPFRAHPPHKDVLFAALKKKLGEPKEEEKYGRKLLVFKEADPRIEVKEDTISHEWDVSVELPRK